jgi:hypothetical protein
MPFVCAFWWSLLRRLAVGMVAGVLVGSAIAQTAVPQTPVYSFAWRGTPLEVSLGELVATTRIDLAYDPPLVAGKRVHCVVQQAPMEAVLPCLLKGTGLDYLRLSSGTYVLTPMTRTAPLYGGLSGVVVNAETGQPIPNAHVFLADAGTGRACNEAGRFTFAQLAPGAYQLVASHLGYRTRSMTVEVPPGGISRAEVLLQAEPILVTPVVIDGRSEAVLPARPGQAQMAQPQWLDAPAAGATDVLQHLDALTGVRVNEVTADVHLQGGEAGEHQFRLDGAPVFLPLNVTTFIGPFSPFALGRLTVHKAGFGAAEGSQIAGVIAAEHHLTEAGTPRLTVQLDPLSANAYFTRHQGRNPARQTTWMTAGRYGLWSQLAPSPLRDLLRERNTIDRFLLSAFADENTTFNAPIVRFAPLGTPGINFHDLHAASRTRMGLLRSLYTSAYWGQQRIGNSLSDDAPTEVSGSAGPQRPATDTSTLQDRYLWQNGVAQMRYETVLGARALLNVRLRGSYYRLRHDFLVPDNLTVGDEDDGNRVHELAAEVTFDYALGHHQNLTLGTEGAYTRSRFTVAGGQILINSRSAGGRWASFFEDEITLGRWVTRIGSRLTYLHNTRTFYAEPRLSTRLDLPDTRSGRWSLLLSGGLYRQFVSQYDVSSRSPRALVSSTRFWLAIDSTVAAPKALHYAGEVHWMPSPAWTLRLEGYYKDQQHILTMDYASNPDTALVNLPQADFLRHSEGYAYGAALRLERKLGPGRALLRYEYNVSERGTDGLFDGQMRPVPWNQPHRFEAALDVQPLRTLTLVARWQSIWGRTWGFRRPYYDFVSAHYNIEDSVLTVRDSGVSGDAIQRTERQVEAFALYAPERHTLPALHQLDVGLAWSFRLGTTAWQARFDLLNALNRQNVAERRLVYDPEVFVQNGGLLLEEDRALLPRTPSFALRLRW